VSASSPQNNAPVPSSELTAILAALAPVFPCGAFSDHRSPFANPFSSYRFNKNKMKTPLRNLLPSVAIFGLSLAINTTAFALGATTLFKTYEAEAGTLAGGAAIRSLGTTLPTAPTPELEASGQKFVELNAANESVAVDHDCCRQYDCGARLNPRRRGRRWHYRLRWICTSMGPFGRPSL